MKRWWIMIVIVLVLAGGFAIWRGSSSKKTESSYRLGVVERGTVQTVVTATGTASAVTTVAVGSQVSGILKEIRVDFNSPVKKGQVIARIDPTFLQAAVSENEASLERAQATMTQAERDLARIKDLFDKQLAARVEYDNALTAVDLARAGMRQAQAQLERSKVNLDYSVITSPIDGVVISRAVDVGQTVAASLQAPELFTIAQDLRDMQIETNIDEADIGSLREGMKATFTVDSYPDEEFEGTISQIRFAATQDQSVVTYPVILTVANPDLKLRPGMTANVTIVTARRENVLRAPATALRFKPTGTPAAKGGAATANAAPQQPKTRATREGGGKRKADSTGVASGDAPKKPMQTIHVKGADGEPTAQKVAVGLNDGTWVEIVSGEVSEGDSVIVGLTGTSAAAAGSQNRMPGMGGPMGGPPGGRR